MRFVLKRPTQFKLLYLKLQLLLVVRTGQHATCKQFVYMIILVSRGIFISSLSNVLLYSEKSFLILLCFLCQQICLYFSLHTLSKQRFCLLVCFSVAIADYGWSIQLITADFSFCLSCQEDSVTIKGSESYKVQPYLSSLEKDLFQEHSTFYKTSKQFLIIVIQDLVKCFKL